ncbi:MAG: hypothetical protein NZ455_00065 [Bacteroidia bacterium]|nr:hypothetical protein [Bacteroidia bacterium]MDW8346620.1 hypothetical protein [Bacteroidia bacterium]
MSSAERSEAPKRQRSPQHADPKRSEGTRPQKSNYFIQKTRLVPGDEYNTLTK